MTARCESIGKYVLPIYRALVAKELVTTYKMTQVEAAQRLGTTQAAISQYINSKRAFKGADQVSDLLPRIQKMATVTAKRLASKEISSDEIGIDLCKVCSGVCPQPNKYEDYTI